MLNQAFTAGFTTAFRVAAAVVLAGFTVALVTTWTGRWRLSSAVTKGREQPCDEVLGTCEVWDEGGGDRHGDPLMKTRGRALVAAVPLVVWRRSQPPVASSSSASTTTPATPTTAATGAATRNGVVIQNFAFTPKTLTVSPGTTVTWTNNDSTPHNVISTASLSLNSATTSVFASGTLSQGQTFSFTFTKKGIYFYECTIHKALPRCMPRSS